MGTAANPAPLTLAIASDLHCHSGDGDRGRSYLTDRTPGTPRARNPVASLVDMVARERLGARVLLVPGDLCDRADRSGIQLGWHSMKEVGAALGAELIVPVIGNHDVATRDGGAHPLAVVDLIRPGFPFENDELCREFLQNGAAVCPLGADADIVAVNTVLGHIDAESARTGLFDNVCLERLDRMLASTRSRPVRIAVMHHHPMLHSSLTGDHDVIPTGDQLLATLAKHGCGAVIHGHKHHPRLATAETPYGRVPVFAAGSFSAVLGDMGAITRNLFHLARVEETGSAEAALRGQISTWEWNMGSGWNPSTDRSAALPHSLGFGRTSSLDDIQDAIVRLAEENVSAVLFSQEQLRGAHADVQFLNEADVHALNRGLSRASALRLERDGKGQLVLGREYQPLSGGAQ